MCKLTEKQFNKAVGKIDEKKYAEFLNKHPVEFTDEWIYEYQKMRNLGKGYYGGGTPIGAGHEGLDIPSGLYHYFSYDQEE